MTTTKLKPRPVRKQVTKKTMTEQTYAVADKQRSYTHTEPVIIDSHLKDVQVLSTASYVQDFKNRVHINNVEVKDLFDQHVEIFNHVKPYVVDSIEWATGKVKELTYSSMSS